MYHVAAETEICSYIGWIDKYCICICQFNQYVYKYWDGSAVYWNGDGVINFSWLHEHSVTLVGSEHWALTNGEHMWQSFA